MATNSQRKPAPKEFEVEKLIAEEVDMQGGVINNLADPLLAGQPATKRLLDRFSPQDGVLQRLDFTANEPKDSLDNFDGEVEGTSPPVNWINESLKNCEVDDAQYKSSPHSMLLTEDSATGYARHERASGWTTNEIEFWMYVDDLDTNQGFHTQATTGIHLLAEYIANVYLKSSDDSIRYYTSGFVSHLTGYNYTLGWHRWKIVLDFINQTYDVWYGETADDPTLTKIVEGASFCSNPPSIKTSAKAFHFRKTGSFADYDMWADDFIIKQGVGDRYLNTTTGTSSETSQAVKADYIYQWNGTDWDEIEPLRSMILPVVDEDKIYFFDTSDTWIVLPAAIPGSSSFPGSPSDNDLYNHSTKKALFRYDATRVKWLTENRATFEFGRATVGAPASVYLFIGDAPGNAATGLKMPRDGTILSVTVDNDNAVTRDVEIRVEDSAVNKVTLSLSAAKEGSKTDGNQDFSAGDVLQAYVPTALGNAMANVQVLVEVAWR